MKLLLVCALLCSYLALEISAVPGGGCKSPDYPSLGEIKRGETKRVSGVCAEVYCDDAGVDVLHNCGPIAVGPPCRAEKGDVKKPYPDCCHEIVCSGKPGPRY